MTKAKEIGKLGEEIGVKFLKKKGYKILDRNFEVRTRGLKLGEIDIIGKKDGVIIFFEVKVLKKEDKISPEQRVNYKKQRTIAKAAQIWLEKNKISLDSPWQIDILSIILDFKTRKAKVRHFKNI